MRKQKEDQDVGKDIGVASLGAASAGIVGTFGGLTLLIGIGVAAAGAYGTYKVVNRIRRKRREKNNTDST